MEGEKSFRILPGKRDVIFYYPIIRLPFILLWGFTARAGVTGVSTLEIKGVFIKFAPFDSQLLQISHKVLPSQHKQYPDYFD